MATTKKYLHLAGTVFRDEAERLEDRLLGGRFSSQPSTHPTAPERISAEGAARNQAEADPSDRF